MLLVDIGNSRIKAGLSGPDGIAPLPGLGTAAARAPSAPWESAFAASARPARVLVSNVAEDTIAASLAQWCRAQWQLEIEIVAPRAHAAGMRTRYRYPEQLGVDRWLASLAAFHLARGAAVAVDCGTALTVDAVSAGGEHLGGVIAPGLGLMAATLSRNTARLDLESLDYAADFPTVTSSAIATGCIESTIGLLLRMRERTAAAGLGGARWFITGGEASAVASQSPMTMLQVPDLVLIGLKMLAQDSR